MRIKNYKIQAFTLIELLIALVIGSIVFLGAYTFLAQQQKTFRRQTEAIRQQSSLRMVLYYITKDLANAGFTGTPLGLESAIQTAKENGYSMPARVVRTIPPSAEFSDLKNNEDKPLDILEIWANFSGLTTTITNSINPGVSQFYVQDPSVFEINVWDDSQGQTVTFHPPGFILGTLSMAKGEYHSLGTVNPSSSLISSSEMITSVYNPGDLVAPLWKRVYFVQEDSQQNRFLVRRDYYQENSVDTVMGENIVDFQVFFDTQDPNTGLMTIEADPDTDIIDPCTIRAVRIVITGLIQTPDMRIPSYFRLSKRVLIRNLWLDPGFDHQCLSTP